MEPSIETDLALPNSMLINKELRLWEGEFIEMRIFP
jgi:hypothetical protein